MERHTLHDAATNAAATQNPSSHSYSAWRNSQQTQPRIFQYQPTTQASQPANSTPPQSQQSTPTVTNTTATIPTTLDKNIIFANNSQQYLPPSQPQPQFTNPTTVAVHSSPDPTQIVQPTQEISSQSDGNKAPSTSPQTAAGGRVLAQSKRAAQNRAAQRAFRQRKERYIKSLEQKANDFDLSQSIIADLRKENIYLRDYVVRLQNEVDSLNTELGRAPMFGTQPAQRPPSNQNQQSALTVGIGQNYPLQIDPQTAAAAAAAAVNVHTQESQSGLARLAPAESAHNAMSMPASAEVPITEPNKSEDAPAQPKRPGRSRKRKNEATAEGQ
jgi:bZIP transcription factor